MASMRKRQLIVSVILFLFSVMPLLQSLNNPRLAALHAADVVALMASGACLGIASVALLGRLMLHQTKVVKGRQATLPKTS